MNEGRRTMAFVHSFLRLRFKRWHLRWWKGRNYFAWMVAAYLMILVTFSLLGDRGLLRSLRLWHECQKLDGEIVELEQDVRDLRKNVDLFRHDIRTIEKFAREELHLAGKNEIHYIFK